MKSAKEVRASQPARKTTVEYVESRIEASAASGYSATKVWVNNTDLNELSLLLKNSGYSTEIVQVDDATDRTQLVINW